MRGDVALSRFPKLEVAGSRPVPRSQESPAQAGLRRAWLVHPDHVERDGVDRDVAGRFEAFVARAKLFGRSGDSAGHRLTGFEDLAPTFAVAQPASR